VFIVDYAGYDAYRAEHFAEYEGRRLTDAEVNESHRIVARTLIPVTDYKEDFAKPSVLINRELGFDEVELVGELPKRRSVRV
jgi:hypothetical protein